MIFLEEKMKYKVGDLVTAVHSKDLGSGQKATWRLGVIIWHKPRPHEHMLEIYKVLTNDGLIDQYTTAALRKVVNESR